MKLNRIALAILVAAPLPMVANAGVTITPLMLGYHYMNEAHDDQRAVLTERNGNQLTTTGPAAGGGVALQSDLYVGAAIGIEVTPWMGVELEYGQTNGDAAANKRTALAGQPWDYKQQMLTANAYVTSDLITQNYEGAFKPYVLLGVGRSEIEVEDPNGFNPSTRDTIGNLGAGAFLRLGETVSLRGEGRAIHNFDNNWWEFMGLAGLQVVLGGHLMPSIPVPPPAVEPVPEPTPEPVVVAPVVVAPVDTDGDGVTDDLDQCPNTAMGVAVDAKGCPVQLTEDLQLELRVFFDINKSNIKDQYKPEVAKVADALTTYKDATAKIEGHTDNTGPRKLNERLSLARANSVKSMLVSQYGIAATRIETQGFAWDKPIAPNDTVEGRAMNRRVYAVIQGQREVVKMQDGTTQPTK
ncbi:MAG: outer membrane protein Omp38 [Flavobacteriales bacterium]